MHYTIITEETYDDGLNPRRIIRNVESEDVQKLISVIYTEIDMVGSKENLRFVRLNASNK